MQLPANSKNSGENCALVDISREEQSPDDTKLMTMGTSSDEALCAGPNSKSPPKDAPAVSRDGF